MRQRIPWNIIALVLVAMFFSGSLAGAAKNISPGKGLPAPSPLLSQGWAILPPPAPYTPPQTTVPLPPKSAVQPSPAEPRAKMPGAKAKNQEHQGKHPVKQSRSKRCEPQSLTYARQRSGIMSCRNGWENGPMTWFAAEKEAGRTSDEPAAGSVLILKGQGHGMPTGHVAYVEEVYPETPSTYWLIFSHTNYDRQCHLETNIEAFYDRAAMTMDVHSGAWRSWGKGLKVAGFIRDN